MKKVVSVCLIALILFNALGFYGVLVGVHYAARKEIASRVERDDFSEDETFTIKLPLSIPYVSNSGYESINGEIIHDGHVFRLIRQKFEHDTLHIVCVSDVKSTSVQKALADYVKTFTDKPIQSKGSKAPVTFVKDYLPVYFELRHESSGWNYKLAYTVEATHLLKRSLPVFSPPPQA